MQLDYLRDLFQPKHFQDSMKISLWEESGEPRGLGPEVLRCGESLWDFALQPSRETRGTTQ